MQAAKIATPLAGARILVVMPSVPLYGMERANLQIMKMMRERGAQVLFVTESTYGEHVCREVERIRCEWVGAPFQGRPSLPHSTRGAFRLAANWRAATTAVREICHAFRPTHVHVTNLSYLLYSLPALRRAGVPVVFRLPNPPPADLPSLFKQLASDQLWRHLVASACDLFVCNSNYTTARLTSLGIDQGKVRVIRNCLPERYDAEADDGPRLDPNCFNIVYLGKIRREKGAAELIAAAERLLGERGDVMFYLAGEYHWQNPFAEALMRNVRKRGLHDRIRFTGDIRDVFGLLRQADLHVCPSISPNDSFPNVILEAKACGVPSVVFPTAGLPEAIAHETDGYVCAAASVGALYDGLRYFLDEPARLRAAGEAAEASLARFSRERAATEWQDLFLSLWRT